MRVRLVKNARKAWSWFSVKALAVITALALAVALLPYEVVAVLPPEWQPWVIAAVAVAGLIGRLIDQGE